MNPLLMDTVVQVYKSVFGQVGGHESILHSLITSGRAEEINFMILPSRGPGTGKVVAPVVPFPTAASQGTLPEMAN